MLSESEKKIWTSRAVLLGWLTIGYNALEGAVSVCFGVEENSIALLGFGVDSFVEVFSAVAVLWRFRHEDLARERRATLVIGALFVLLATFTAAVSFYQIVNHRHPDTTLPGLIVAAVSLSFMFFLWKAKRNVAFELDSRTVLQDAACSMACIQLSFVLFIGSICYLLVPALYWIDSAAAIVIAAMIAREGVAAIRSARSENFSGGCGCSAGGSCD